MPEYSNQFIIQEKPSLNGNDFFEIENGKNQKIIIRGNNPISIASGFNYYLKHVANCHISWNGDQLNLPSKLPPIIQKIRKESLYKSNFNFNYCTFNYTMLWWDWNRWEREIDFMALNGVNMPLAIVGMEAVWYNFLKRYNYSDKDAKEFISGPGYTAWWLMGNLEGRGGPMTSEWIEGRIVLQKKILKRMRKLGMRPVLPGFVGLVPTSLDKVVPSAKLLDQGKWLNDTRPAVLNPETPLFDEMAKAWYEELDNLYGSVDAFSGDLFHEGGKTHGLDIGNIAAKVQKHMIEYNPNSIWCIQGWGGNPKKTLLEGLKDENTLIIELCGEYFKNWRKTDGFNGKPWVFSTIIQYGGNVGLHGRLKDLANNLIDAQSIKNEPIGIGTTWESIEINPIINDFLSDMRWESNVPDIEEWCENYAVRRYGFDSENIRKGWNIILKTAYGTYKNHRRPTESIFCAPPSLKVKKASPFAASIKVHYDQRDFRDAINLMLLDAEIGADQATYKYDIVDFTRQFMANAAQIPYNLMVKAFQEKNISAFEESAGQFLEMIDDQDRLLATETSFLLGKWINDARKSTTTPKQIAQNESNARVLITTWTKEKSGLDNYAWREWNGLLSTYYKPRWELFINNLRNQLNGASAQKTDFYSFQSKWSNQKWEDQNYLINPIGNPLKIAKELIKKWSFLIDNPEKYMGPKTKKTDKIETSKEAR
ncbi:MAG: alpha-N-acetylglucosaminidase [Flavobacteriaceae bacterium]|nr:alpha-N-acetylglucosaminidase [Flavobacteriaceae bacterium]